jgi:hypothetical protein
MAATYLNVSENLRTVVIYQNWVFDFCSDLWLWILRSALIIMRGMLSVPVSINCPPTTDKDRQGKILYNFVSSLCLICILKTHHRVSAVKTQEADS